jgi:2-phospho-L-lactate guanylyltransferase (CobY/MobA/RfbA family)
MTMKEDVRRAALAALSASSHFHKGIRPAGAADQEAPCRLLSTDDPDGFDEAVAAAENQWPAQTEWDIIASDYALATEQETSGRKESARWECHLPSPGSAPSKATDRPRIRAGKGSFRTSNEDRSLTAAAR